MCNKEINLKDLKEISEDELKSLKGSSGNK